MQVRKQQLELDMEQKTGSKLGKEYVKAVYCQPAYLTYIQSTSWETLGWRSTAGIKIAGRNINNLRSITCPPYGRKWRGTKEPLDESERREWKAGLKLNIQKAKIMPSGPITSWQIDGQTMKTVIDFIFMGSKINADGDCSQEIKRHLLLGRKAMTNLDSVLKSRDIILLPKFFP